jgi:hypothetical protein
MEKGDKPIDKVTTSRMEMTLRMCGIHLDYDLIDKIIDVVELIEDKGGEVTLDDAFNLQEAWEEQTNNLLKL